MDVKHHVYLLTVDIKHHVYLIPYFLREQGCGKAGRGVRGQAGQADLQAEMQGSVGMMHGARPLGRTLTGRRHNVTSNTTGRGAASTRSATRHLAPTGNGMQRKCRVDTVVLSSGGRKHPEFTSTSHNGCMVRGCFHVLRLWPQQRAETSTREAPRVMGVSVNVYKQRINNKIISTQADRHRRGTG